MVFRLATAAEVRGLAEVDVGVVEAGASLRKKSCRAQARVVQSQAFLTKI